MQEQITHSEVDSEVRLLKQSHKRLHLAEKRKKGARPE